MSTFVGTLLLICIHFFHVFLFFLLILILNKLVNSYIFPLGKFVKHRLKLGILFATLGQLAAKILVFCRYTPFIFWRFSLYSNVYINFHFCLFLLLYIPCQQLWSLREGQFTYPHFFLGRLEQAVTQ